MENNEIDYNHKEIPENSKTLLIDETTSRFSGALWYDCIKEQHVLLLGCGGIGSWTALLLSRLKINTLIIYDPDIVEANNMSGQLYKITDVGIAKVTAIAATMKEFSNFNSIITHIRPFSSLNTASDIMICGFDNMSARAVAFNAWTDLVARHTEEDTEKCLFIDGRLSADEFQVFAIQGNDEKAIAKYKEEWLFSDYEAEETVCSFKQTSFMANMIASVMVNIFVNFVANQVDDIVSREVPFLTRYSSDNMFFKLE